MSQCSSPDSATPSMDIYAKPGTRVRFTGQGGYDHHKEHAGKFLTVDSIYTVAGTTVSAWHTDVYLEEFPKEGFNSVMFVEVSQPAQCSAGIAAPAERSSFTKLAAECHRAKWQFDVSAEQKLNPKDARDLVAKAFDALHRIGDMAMKLRDEARTPDAAQTAPVPAKEDEVFDLLYANVYADNDGVAGLSAFVEVLLEKFDVRPKVASALPSTERQPAPKTVRSRVTREGVWNAEGK